MHLIIMRTEIRLWYDRRMILNILSWSISGSINHYENSFLSMEQFKWPKKLFRRKKKLKENSIEYFCWVYKFVTQILVQFKIEFFSRHLTSLLIIMLLFDYENSKCKFLSMMMMMMMIFETKLTQSIYYYYYYWMWV